MSIQQIEQKVQAAWAHLPAKVTVKEIERKTQLPHWKVCGRDELHVGVIRRKHSDRLVVVKHGTIANYDLACLVEELLPDADAMRGTGLAPKPDHDYKCTACQKFSTRIDTDGRCVDCK